VSVASGADNLIFHVPSYLNTDVSPRTGVLVERLRCNGPPPEKKALYMRLSIIQDVVEWGDSSLLDAGELECATRIETLMSCSKYYGLGPTDTELSQGR
jgi:hypothetical protein